MKLSDIAIAGLVLSWWQGSTSQLINAPARLRLQFNTRNYVLSHERRNNDGEMG